MKQTELQVLVEQISITAFGVPFQHKAVFNKRLRTTGGRYHLNTHHLDFNPLVLEKLGKEIFIDVIKHELCHYHLHLAGKGHQHKDKEFKDLLKKVNGLRYVPSLKETINLWQYQCKTCKLITQRQRRFNTNKFACAKCRGQFELLGRESVSVN